MSSKSEEHQKPSADVVEITILPLANLLQEACKKAYPPKRYLSATLRQALRSTLFEEARQILEFFISPAYARVFCTRVKGPVDRLDRFENKAFQLVPDDWPEPVRKEYFEIWNDIEYAAAYLRLLAALIKSKRAAKQEEVQVRLAASSREGPQERRKKMNELTLSIIDACIQRGRSPMECLLKDLRSISKDRWLDDLRDTFPEIRSFGDVADRGNPAHVDMFDRFKKVYYRRRNELRAKGKLAPKKQPPKNTPK